MGSRNFTIKEPLYLHDSATSTAAGFPGAEDLGRCRGTVKQHGSAQLLRESAGALACVRAEDGL